jgi:GAF domain
LRGSAWYQQADEYMTVQNSERWKQLCAQISVEQDTTRLLQMVGELVQELDAKVVRPIPHMARSANPLGSFPHRASVLELLNSAMKATNAPFGTVQFLDESQAVLRIVAHHGFDAEFVHHFETVRTDSSCTCGVALREQMRIVVTDVATDPIYENNREAMLRAKVRAVQSTPLFGPAGKLVGIFSTHYDENRTFSAAELKALDELAAGFTAQL